MTERPSRPPTARGGSPAAGSDRLAPFVRDPEGCALVMDFDGTLSAIVDDPASAVPAARVPAVLERLRDRLGLVAVVSGRPVDFLLPLLPEGVMVAGLYGLESVIDGRRRDHPQAGVWREVVDDVAARADARAPDGTDVERKDLSITLHYRTHPEAEQAVTSYAAAEAARSGLVARPARKSLELHPPIDVDKGTALEELAEDFSAIGFAGDDVGDLPAFDALDRLDERGIGTLRVAVRSEEAPPDLLARADLVVEGPEGLVTLLETLV